MTFKQYLDYVVYSRREKFLGNPFITESDSDIAEIDKFLKVVENYLNLEEELKKL